MKEPYFLRHSYMIFMATTIIILQSCIYENRTKERSIDNRGDSDTIAQSLINKYGADEYGMKTYIMAFLKKGPVRNQDSITARNIQREHLNNIKRLSDSGLLVLAGPFLDTGELRGIYIFNVATLEEAKALTETDPAIKSGRLEMELHPWYGSAALQDVNRWHKKIAKKSI